MSEKVPGYSGLISRELTVDIVHIRQFREIIMSPDKYLVERGSSQSSLRAEKKAGCPEHQESKEIHRIISPAENSFFYQWFPPVFTRQKMVLSQSPPISKITLY